MHHQKRVAGHNCTCVGCQHCGQKLIFLSQHQFLNFPFFKRYIYLKGGVGHGKRERGNLTFYGSLPKWYNSLGWAKLKPAVRNSIHGSPAIVRDSSTRVIICRLPDLLAGTSRGNRVAGNLRGTLVWDVDIDQPLVKHFSTECSRKIDRNLVQCSKRCIKYCSLT